MHIASHAVKYLGFDPSRINILSFYNAQRDLLEKSMQKEKLKAVSVVSVDAMQGREADLIILSCVRADVTVGARADGTDRSVGKTSRPKPAAGRAFCAVLNESAHSGGVIAAAHCNPMCGARPATGRKEGGHDPRALRRNGAGCH